MANPADPRNDAADPSEHRTTRDPRKILSDELFAESKEVQIEHAGEIYRLRKTKTGKLILTK